jgi:aminopeptidase
MKDISVLSDLEKVKAICDPLRIKLLKLLIHQDLTAKQLACHVQQSSSKIHYHVKELEKQGLIELVHTAEKGGILEKYYRAVANNYFIDQSLGDYFEKNETRSVEFVKKDILSWRRVHRLKVDVQALAHKIIETSLQIKEGEVVAIIAGMQQIDLVEPLTVEIQKVGAYPLLSINTTKTKEQLMEQSSSDYLDNYFQRLAETFRPVTTLIMLEHIVDPFIVKKIPHEQVELYRKAWAKVRNELYERKVKWAFIGYPTHSQAVNMNLDFLLLHDTFWKSIDVDYHEIKVSANAVAQILLNGKDVRIQSEKGTRLQFSIAGRNPLMDDGIITDEDLKNGDTVINLPSGEVYIAPVEESVEGIAVFDIGYYQGEKIEGIRLEFSKGKVIGFSAEKNELKLSQFFESEEVGRKVLGELGVGLNPWIKQLIGYQVCDTKQLGSIHLSLGENRMFGGKNSATIHWPLVMTEINLWIDDIQLIENGELLLDSKL